MPTFIRKSNQASTDLDGDLATLPYRKDRGAQVFVVAAAAAAAAGLQSKPQRLVSKRTFNIHLAHGRDELAPERGMNFAQTAPFCSQVKGGSFGEKYDAFILAMRVQPISFGKLVTIASPIIITAADDLGGGPAIVGPLMSDSLVQGTDSTLNTSKGNGSMLSEIWRNTAQGMSVSVLPVGSKCANEFGGVEQFPDDLKLSPESDGPGFPMLGTHGWLRDPIFIAHRSGDAEHDSLRIKFENQIEVADTQLIGTVDDQYALIYEVKYIVALGTSETDGSFTPANDRQAAIIARHAAAIAAL